MSTPRISTSACEGRRVAHFIHFRYRVYRVGPVARRYLSSGPPTRDRRSPRLSRLTRTRSSDLTKFCSMQILTYFMRNITRKKR